MVMIEEKISKLRLVLTGKLVSALPGYTGKAPRFLSYYSTLYYVEIIYFMFMILIIYGRMAAVISGLVFTGLLTLHIIRLFLQRNFNRKIQIVLMDIHIAFTAGFLINRILGDLPLSGPDEFMIIFRGLTALLEITFVFIFTDDRIIQEYS
jgi:hypothetical protein